MADRLDRCGGDRGPPPPPFAADRRRGGRRETPRNEGRHTSRGEQANPEMLACYDPALQRRVIWCHAGRVPTAGDTPDDPTHQGQAAHGVHDLGERPGRRGPRGSQPRTGPHRRVLATPRRSRGRTGRGTGSSCVPRGRRAETEGSHEAAVGIARMEGHDPAGCASSGHRRRTMKGRRRSVSSATSTA